MFPDYTIANHDLTQGDIPSITDEWCERLRQFALSFDGYQFTANQPGKVGVSNLAEFVRPVTQAFAVTGALPSPLSLSELRACLFWEQRRDHHAGTSAIRGKQFDYIQALLEGIKDKVRDRGFQ